MYVSESIWKNWSANKYNVSLAFYRNSLCYFIHLRLLKTIQKHLFSHKMSSKSHNEAEVQSLQGEGGSDVFTTTRHINNPNQQQQVRRKSKFMLKILNNYLTTFCTSQHL